MLNFIDFAGVVKADVLQLLSCVLSKRLLGLELLEERNLVLSLLSIISTFLLVFIGQLHYIIPESDDQIPLTFKFGLLL